MVLCTIWLIVLGALLPVGYGSNNPTLLGSADAGKPITTLLFQKGTNYLLSGHDTFENQLRLWRVTRSTAENIFSANDTLPGWRSSAAVLDIDTCNNGHVVTASWDGAISVWKSVEGPALDLVSSANVSRGGHRLPAHGVRFSPNCRNAASIGFDGLRIWNVKTDGTLDLAAYLPEVIGTAVATSQKFAAFYAGGPKGLVVVYQANNTWEFIGVEPQLENIITLATSYDGWQLFAGMENGVVGVWSTRQLQPQFMQSIEAHSHDVLGLWPNKNGDMLVTSGHDRTVRLWKVGQGGTLKAISMVSRLPRQLSLDSITGAAFHPSENSVLLLGCWSELAFLDLSPRPTPYRGFFDSEEDSPESYPSGQQSSKGQSGDRVEADFGELGELVITLVQHFVNWVRSLNVPQVALEIIVTLLTGGRG